LERDSRRCFRWPHSVSPVLFAEKPKCEGPLDSSPIQPWIARPSHGGAPGSRSETAGGVFHIREDEPAPRVGAGLHRTP